MEDAFGAMTTRTFWITDSIAQGNFLDSKKAKLLQSLNVTHILNVSDVPHQIRGEDYGFAEMLWIPTEDHVLFPKAKVLEMVQAQHRMVIEEEGKLYVHCVAGQNRSATALWLFFVACGLEREEARRMIEEKNIDAVAGYPRLVDEDRIQSVIRYGRDHFQETREHPALKRPSRG